MTDDRDRTQPLSDPGAGREVTSRTSGGIVATAFGLTDVGMQRSVNQDTLGNRAGQHPDQLPTLGLLYAVADGMGGHARGEVASALAIQHLFALYYGADPAEDPRQGLERVMLQTNAAVHQAGREAGGASMGTTLTLALLRDGALYVGNIGDSRTYRIRHGAIEQLTHDHSLIGEQVRSGLLTESQARQSSIRNVITRAVGYREEVEADVFTYPVQVGDIILLCSDGLHSMVESQELAQHLSTQPLGVAIPDLIDLAKQRGGPDNITALAVRIDGLAPQAATRDNAVTIPMSPAMNDAVTKPFVRAEGEAGGGAEAAAAAVATMPMPPPPPPPAASPPAPVIPVPPAPATRSSGRFPLLLLALPVLLLLLGGGLIVAMRQGGDNQVAATARATVQATPTVSPAPTIGPAGGLPTTTAVGSAQPNAAAAPAPSPTATPENGASLTSPKPSTVGQGPQVVNTPTAGVVSSSSSSAAPSSPASGNVTIVSGSITFNGAAPTGDMEIVVYLAADLPPRPPGSTLPPKDQLAERAPTWRGTISEFSSQRITYTVQGAWKGTAAEQAIIALRFTENGQTMYLYPDENKASVTLKQNEPNTAYDLIFTR